ncbi:MAG: glycosyltransferase family 1 protein [Candidatus Sumerlaeia bacterium]|nr:glycosyltransferase family 1 protein [Candidatus Sumerlaeia bacterium]
MKSVPLEKPEVLVDCRMLENSGIGVLLRQLLRCWSAETPPFTLKLLGNRKVLAKHAPINLDAEFITFTAPVYGPGALFSGNPHKRGQLYVSPHYSVPLFGLRMKSVVMIQDLLHITQPTKPGTRLYMKTMLALLRKRATLVVTPSRHTKVQLQTLHGFQAHRVLTHPLGPGLAEEFPSVPNTEVEEAPLHFKAPQRYWLTAGIDKPHKNFDSLLGAYQKVAMNGDTPPLLMAGLDERGRSRIARKVHQFGIAERVTLVPRLPDTEFRLLFQQASALLFPSLEEGFGFPLVEALRLGVPVLCADLPPMNDLAGGCATLFDPDEPGSLEQALKRMKSPDMQRVQWGTEHSQQWRWSKFTEQLNETIHRALVEF